MAPPDHDDGDPKPAPDRRRFLKIATCALGGGVGAAVVIPAARYVLYPVGRRTVTAAAEPIDAIALDALGPVPIKVPLVASSVRDAWATATDVALGAAWVRRDEQGKVHALSSVCPHLGCAVAFDPAAKEFKCPCHDSAFTAAGEKIRGPSERGLDPLDVAVDGNRVKITWVRYRVGGATREPA